MTVVERKHNVLTIPGSSPHREALEALVTESETLLVYFANTTPIDTLGNLEVGWYLGHRNTFIALLGRTILDSGNVNLASFMKEYPTLAKALFDEMTSRLLPSVDGDKQGLGNLGSYVDKLRSPDFVAGGGRNVFLWHDHLQDAANIVADYVQTGGKNMGFYLVGDRSDMPGSKHSFYVNNGGIIVNWREGGVWPLHTDTQRRGNFGRIVDLTYSVTGKEGIRGTFTATLRDEVIRYSERPVHNPLEILRLERHLYTEGSRQRALSSALPQCR